jgi:hypothetical protein
MKPFPILGLTSGREQEMIDAAGYNDLRRIPWDMIEPHEPQALKNHDQSLKTLASRQGLSACEMLAVLEDRPWKSIELVESYRKLDALIALFFVKQATQ